MSDEVRYDNKSRLGITLSQTNINQSLKHHFIDNNKSALIFHAQLGEHDDDPEFSLIGRIDPPTIQLIDAEKADQAIYTLKFHNGEYIYWAPDADSHRAAPKQRKVSAKGWTIAFYVSFAMEKVVQLPEWVRKVAMKPGSYSVEQLVIVFGTADLIKFKLDECTFPNLAGSAALLDVKKNLGKFVDKWLISLKSAGPGHILGYTVKVDGDPSQDQLFFGNTSSLTFPSPPTSV